MLEGNSRNTPQRTGAIVQNTPIARWTTEALNDST